MKLLSRREYNLILRSLDYYDVFMNKRERELREQLEDKLYYNLYNPKDGVAQKLIQPYMTLKQRKIRLKMIRLENLIFRS